MNDDEVFCPSCSANIGPGTLNAIGCPWCDHPPEVEEDETDEDEEVEG